MAGFAAAAPYVLGAIGAAGSLFGGKKKSLDITPQLNQIKQNIAQQRVRADTLFGDLQAPLKGYETDTAAALEAARARAEQGRSQFMTEQGDLSEQTKNALRSNLYSKTFGGLPDTLRAVREASAAGSGIDSGAYQQAVQNVGRDTSRALVEGETALQAEGLRGQQSASQVAYQTFENLSSKLDDQQLGLIAKVMDTKRADLVQRTAQQMGLDNTEIQAIVDLMNMQSSSNLAADAASDAARQSLFSGLTQLGGTIYGKSGNTSAPTAK